MSREGFVYLAKSDHGLWKIGFSRDAEKRIAQLDGAPYSVTLAHKIASVKATWLERILHERFVACRVRGEWFRLDDAGAALIMSVSRCDGIRDLPSALIPERILAVRPARSQRRAKVVAMTGTEYASPVSRETFGQRIARMRQALGLSQTVFAHRAGCNRQNISEIERGNRDPQVSLAVAIAAALGVMPGALLDDVAMPG